MCSLSNPNEQIITNRTEHALWRHVDLCAILLRHLSFTCCQSKVADLRNIPVENEHVLGLNVAVHKAHLVDVAETGSL